MDATLFWHSVGRQLQRPTGLGGRLAGALMRITNARPNRLAIAALRIDPHDTVLELGCGPGGAIQNMTLQTFEGRVLGVDQSPVMLEYACRANSEAIAP